MNARPIREQWFDDYAAVPFHGSPHPDAPEMFVKSIMAFPVKRGWPWFRRNNLYRYRVQWEFPEVRQPTAVELAIGALSLRVGEIHELLKNRPGAMPLDPKILAEAFDKAHATLPTSKRRKGTK